MKRALLFLAFGLACSRGDARKPVVWETIAPGIQHARVEVAGTPAFNGHAFVVDLAQAEVRVLAAKDASGRETVDAIAAEVPEHIAVNGSFFDPAGKAMGRVVDHGAATSMTRRSGWGALVIDRDVGGTSTTGAVGGTTPSGATDGGATGADGGGTGSVTRVTGGDAGNDAGAPIIARVVLGDSLPKELPGGDLVMQGVPRLVVDGAVVKLKPQTAARTAVCADKSRLVIVVTTDAETSELARFLADPIEKGGLGCVNALNLDGGPSTQLSAKVGSFSAQMPGGWGVPNALVVIPRAPSATR